MKKIIYSKKSIKFIKKQNKQTISRIINAIEKIPEGDIKKLRGTKEYLRLRVGDYRIIFKNNTVINILDINNRGDVYK